MYIWYDDRFTQMKRSNAHEVSLGAVLGMLLVYLCPHLCWKHRELHTLFMYVCSKRNRTSVSFINKDAEHAGFIFKVFLQLNIYRY